MIYLPAWPPGISLKWPSLPGWSEADLGFSSTAVLLGSFKRRMRLGFLYFGTVNRDTGKDILVKIRIVGRKRQQKGAGPCILDTPDFPGVLSPGWKTREKGHWFPLAVFVNGFCTAPTYLLKRSAPAAGVGWRSGESHEHRWPGAAGHPPRWKPREMRAGCRWRSCEEGRLP